MKRFWLKWIYETSDPWPTKTPPGEMILGCWVTGVEVCALVLGGTIEDAKAAVHTDWPESKDAIFTSTAEVDEGWLPPKDRFSRDDWMVERMTAAAPVKPGAASSVITVRITPERHFYLKKEARARGLSLNKWCVQKLGIGAKPQQPPATTDYVQQRLLGFGMTPADAELVASLDAEQQRLILRMIDRAAANAGTAYPLKADR